MSEYLSTGMITRNTTNPLDEIPVGPQVFPFGTPTLEKSNVEPYQSTNYGYTTNSTHFQKENVFQAKNNQETNDYQTTSFQTKEIAKEDYQINEYKNYEVNNYTASNISLVNNDVNFPSTKYQLNISYKPAIKTLMIPMLISKYVPVSPNEGVQTSSSDINPPSSIPDPFAQQSLPMKESELLSSPFPHTKEALIKPLQQKPENISMVPLMPKPENISMVPLLPKPENISMVPIPILDNPHFVRNYPIYENDRRRISSNIIGNSSSLEAIKQN